MSKFKLLFFIAVLAMFTVVSCGKDDDPKTLSYSKTTGEEFKLWIGSAEGGKEINTSSISLDEIFLKKI